MDATQPGNVELIEIFGRSIGCAPHHCAPNVEDPRRIAAGAERYAALCVGCHPGAWSDENPTFARALSAPTESFTRRQS